MKIIVTGAASGIGRASAHRLQRDVQQREGRGAEFLLVDVNGDKLEGVARELTAQGRPRWRLSRAIPPTRRHQRTPSGRRRTPSAGSML